MSAVAIEELAYRIGRSAQFTGYLVADLEAAGFAVQGEDGGWHLSSSAEHDLGHCLRSLPGFTGLARRRRGTFESEVAA